jgi:uncharacterized protein (TIGR02452 family)
MEAFQRRIDVWRDTEATAPALVGGVGAVKEWHDASYDFSGGVGCARVRSGWGPTRVFLCDADTIDAGRELAVQGHRPLLLILADDCFPGGCVFTGSGAQEEALFRRTNLFRSLDLRLYPIRDDEALYAPGVAVFKEGERAARPFERVPPYLLDFVACPALRHPVLRDEDGGRLCAADAARLRRKVELVLQVAHRHGHDAVVLGAMGCGAWKSPPEHVAEIMRDALRALPQGAFRAVAVAVLSGAAPGYVTVDHSSRPDNHAVFSRFFDAVPPSCDRQSQ